MARDRSTGGQKAPGRAAVPGTGDLLDELAAMRAALAKSEHARERLVLALENTGVGVWDWNVQTGTFWMSGAGLAMQGFEEQPPVSFDNVHEHFVHPADWQRWRRKLVACLKGAAKGEYVEHEHLLKRCNGSPIWIMERARVVARDGARRALRVIGTRTDTTARREAEERLRWLAQHDPLTGLPNRAVFDDMLTAALIGPAQGGHRAGLIFVDLDNFKQVNDEEGHERGDAVLCEVAARLRSAFPAPATAARIGGDEFGIIVPRLDVAGDFEPLCRLAATLGADIGLSVGGAVYPLHADSLRALKQAADRALYRAKKEGRGRACLFDPRRDAGGGSGRRA